MKNYETPEYVVFKDWKIPCKDVSISQRELPDLMRPQPNSEKFFMRLTQLTLAFISKCKGCAQDGLSGKGEWTSSPGYQPA